MPSLPNALDAARSSGGYLFSVVALAGLLTALAAIQWVRDGYHAEASSGQAIGEPRDETRNLAETPQAEIPQAGPPSSDRLQRAEAFLASIRQDQEAALIELDRLNRAAKRLDREIRTQEALVDQARRLGNQTVLHDRPQRLPPVEPEDSQIGALETSLARLQAQRDQLLGRFTPQHPIVQEVHQRIAEVDALLQQDRSERTVSPARPVEPPRGTSADVADRRLLAAEQKLAQLRQELQELNASRDEQTLYLADLQHEIARRLEEVELAQPALPRRDGRDLPAVELVRVSPGEDRVGAFALIFALATGCGVGCIASLKAKAVSRHLNSRSEIESILALPLIGLLPGMDDSPEPAPLPDLRTARRIRGSAELILGVFAAATAAAVTMVDGYSDRLTSQPLSAVADGLRMMATLLFG